LDKNGYRKFGITMGVVIAVLFGLFFPFILNLNIPTWPWSVSLVFILWGLIIPNTLIVVYKPWMKVGSILGFINTRTILTIVFFAIFTPFSIFLKIINKDLLNRKIDKNHISSYWKRSNKQNKSHMENIY